jgi:hypothetical protein
VQLRKPDAVTTGAAYTLAALPGPGLWTEVLKDQMRAPVLQRAEPHAAPGERDRAAVDGSAADPALGRDVGRIDPVPAAVSHV